LPAGRGCSAHPLTSEDLDEETGCQLVEAGQLIFSQVEDLDEETFCQLVEAGQLILSQVMI